MSPLHAQVIEEVPSCWRIQIVPENNQILNKSISNHCKTKLVKKFENQY